MDSDFVDVLVVSVNARLREKQTAYVLYLSFL
jgi:hypothetical protein